MSLPRNEACPVCGIPFRRIFRVHQTCMSRACNARFLRDADGTLGVVTSEGWFPAAGGRMATIGDRARNPIDGDADRDYLVLQRAVYGPALRD